ncbi:MAG: prolipoprotein diacylglyceryl transferase, partial [Cyclobacteriaceae bacterium]|nr:prolipoprotein diacylglyceryl transferase [Cyclobacteriaceae bacterium]MCK5469377.1 prolipoprotein diacylglyceryl transferase [Cyclobacteriaceae bacterium]
TNVKTILSNYEYISLHIYEPPGNQIVFETSQNSKGRQIVTIKTKAIARHPAQLYESISSFIIFVLLFLIWNRRKDRLPEGFLFGVFLILLFGLRFLYEYIKENQVDFEDTMTLNMGQILSIPLVIAGILILLNLKKLQPKKSD